ncbi:MAG: class I SAM-dependent methyltransferase [Propionibacteriaceae bacterium]
MSADTPPDPDQYAQQLARQARAAGSATAWFDDLYAASEQGAAVVPWDRGGPHPLLQAWVHERAPDGRGLRALVVGTGPGHDAELLADLGYATTAFDISPTAVQAARARFPASAVDYQVADLLALPADWDLSFDLVVEIFTVQSLPPELRSEATAAVRRVVAPGGTLLVVAFVSDSSVEDGPPWPLTGTDLEAFAVDGLSRVGSALSDQGRSRVEFRRQEEG